MLGMNKMKNPCLKNIYLQGFYLTDSAFLYHVILNLCVLKQNEH